MLHATFQSKYLFIYVHIKNKQKHKIIIKLHQLYSVINMPISKYINRLVITDYHISCEKM